MKRNLILFPLFVILLSLNISLSTKITGYLCTDDKALTNKLVCDNVAETVAADSRFHSCDFDTFSEGEGGYDLKTDDCRGTTLDPKIPEMFPKLEKYDISHHGIETITPEDLRLNKLVIFTASHNKLTSIPAGLFKYAPKLLMIDLEFNQITALEEGSFSEISDSTSISLQNNPIRHIDGKIFLPISFRIPIALTWENVEEFDISLMNGIFDFKRGTFFDGFSYGREDSSNSYSTKTIENKCFVNLKVFNASGTPVKNVVNLLEVFGPSIEVLDLSWNSIGPLNASVFNRFSHLEHLNLSNANLTSIDFNGFHNRATLKVLDLSNNNLNGIDFAPSVGVFENLQTLNLKGNKVSDIPKIFPKLSSIEWSVRIESNAAN